MIAIITAGGKGTRLSSIAVDIPKPMVRVSGKPILQYQIECLRDSGIVDIFIILGHLGKIIKDYFGDGSQLGVNIRYVEEPYPLGSAGALFFFKHQIENDFIFIFGDLMLDIDFKRMIEYHYARKASITLFSHPNSHPFDSDLIICSQNNKVVDVDSKNNIRDYYYQNLVNAGIYVISKNILNLYFETLERKDFEKDILFKEIKKNTVFAYKSSEYVKDAGTPDRYLNVCADVSNGIVRAKNLKNRQKCVFLDRDGTINKYVGFAKTIDSIELERGVADGLKSINNSEYLAIVITNQPVVARGDISFKELNEIHKKIETLLGREGAYYDDLFFCPHHPDKGFTGEIAELKINCNCRKPKIGLLIEASKKYNIDLSKSYIVGDTTVDIQTGINAGVKTILVRTGKNGLDGKHDVRPDYIIDSLDEIKSIIGD